MQMPLMFIAITISLCTANDRIPPQSSPTLDALLRTRTEQLQQQQSLESYLEALKKRMYANETLYSKKSRQLYRAMPKPQRESDIQTAREWQQIYAQRGDIQASNRYARKAEHLERKEEDKHRALP